MFAPLQKFSASCRACLSACMRAHGHAAWWVPIAPHVLPQGSCTDAIPTRKIRAPSSTASSPSVFLVSFSSTQCRSAPPLSGHRPQRRRPAGPRPAKGGFLLLLSMIPFLSLRFQFNHAVFHMFSPTPAKQNQVWSPPLLSSPNFRAPKRNVGEPLVPSHQFPSRFRRRARRILTSITGHDAWVPICDWDSHIGTQL
jgi:hypothetical protein